MKAFIVFLFLVTTLTVTPSYVLFKTKPATSCYSFDFN